MTSTQIIQDFLTINRYYSKFLANQNTNIELSNYFSNDITITSFFDINKYLKCNEIIINKDNALNYLKSIMQTGYISKYSINNNILSIKIHYNHELVIYLNLIFLFNENYNINKIIINKI